MKNHSFFFEGFLFLSFFLFLKPLFLETIFKISFWVKKPKRDTIFGLFRPPPTTTIDHPPPTTRVSSSPSSSSWNA